jgi:hypothetical protein
MRLRISIPLLSLAASASLYLAAGASAGPPPSPPAKPGSTTTPAPIPAPSFTPYAGYDPDPCYRANEHDAADLCAQWRAALAAESSAHQAERAVDWSIWATFLSFLSLVAVAVSLYFNASSNRTARDTAKRQLRAYVAIEKIAAPTLQIGVVPRFVIDVRNFGQTPAHKYDIVSFVTIARINADETALDDPANTRESPSSLAPGALNHAYPHAASAWTAPFNEAFLAGQLRLYVHGYAIYEDIYGAPRKTHFKVYFSRDCPAGHTLQCTTGNYST